MLKKRIKYTDYDGVEREEDFYFNLNKAEVTEMELSIDGGLTKMLNTIVAEKNAPLIITTFKQLILKAYGEKSADGKRFMKSAEISDKFEHTEAYSELFMEIAVDAEKASEFVNAIITTIN